MEMTEQFPPAFRCAIHFRNGIKLQIKLDFSLFIFEILGLFKAQLIH
jgi:hypothetical protein